MKGRKKTIKNNEIIIETQKTINELVNKVSLLENKCSEINSEKNKLEKECAENELKLKSLNEKYEKSLKNEIRLKKKCVKLEKKSVIEYIDVLDKLESKLKSIEKYCLDLENKNLDLTKKYKALSSSKLGKITLKYWKVKKGKDYA